MELNLSEPVDHYFYELGKFIHAFSEVEVMLQVSLHSLAGTSFPVSTAIFSGVQSDRARDFIRRIYDGYNKKLSPIVDRAFIQLAHISRIRNDIVHHGARFDAGSEFGVVSNFISSPPNRVRETQVSGEFLSRLSADLQQIRAAIVLEFLIPDVINQNDATLVQMREEASRTWQCKLP